MKRIHIRSGSQRVKVGSRLNRAPSLFGAGYNVGIEHSLTSLGASVRQLVKRVPFTLTLLALITSAALITGAFQGAIDPAWFERVGYAPCDLWHLRLDRVLISALFTERPRGFYQALWLIALGVGGVEWRFGSAVAFGCFWGLHTLTLALNTLLLGMASVFVPVSGIVSARDIGPSAGYFGALAVFFGTLASRDSERATWWRWFNPVVLTGLASVLMWSLIVPTRHIVITANLAHVITYALGGWVAQPPPRRRGSNVGAVR